MKRTLVQLDDATYRELRQRAFRQERSMSSLVRELVAKGLQDDAARERPRRAAQFSSVRAGRSKQGPSKQGPLSAVSEQHDEALAATFEK
jgi:plasmid stability protein